jgi:hypothetical protein
MSNLQPRQITGALSSQNEIQQNKTKKKKN